VLGAQRLFQDRKRPLVKGLGLDVAALGAVERRQVVDAGCHVEVLGARRQIALQGSTNSKSFFWPCLSTSARMGLFILFVVGFDRRQFRLQSGLFKNRLILFVLW
jgi:hypothetical protein